MKRYVPLFECEECNCQNQECPCKESCSRKKESCLCEECPEGTKPSGIHCVGAKGERIQNHCNKGGSWDRKAGKCIPNVDKPEHEKCPTGTIWDDKANKCIPHAKK